jgi:phosphotransferase system enzyme I (PtsI)
MLIKRGIAVSPGVISGPAFVMGAEDFRIPHRFVRVTAVESEIARFRAALDAVCDEIAGNAKMAAAQLGKQYGQIFSAHLQMARDPQFVDRRTAEA